MCIMSHESLVEPKVLCKKPCPPAPRITRCETCLRHGGDRQARIKAFLNHRLVSSPTISHDFPAFPTISRPPPPGAADQMSAHRRTGQYIEHGRQVQRSHGGRIASFGRRMVRNAVNGEVAIHGSAGASSGNQAARYGSSVIWITGNRMRSGLVSCLEA